MNLYVRRLYLLLGVIVVFALPIEGSAEKIVIPVLGDTYNRSDQSGATSSGNGTGATFSVGELNTNADLHGLLRFDLSSLPEGATIESVSLTLYLGTGDDGSAAGSSISLYELVESFDENTANWASRSNISPAGPVSWTSAGGTTGEGLGSLAVSNPTSSAYTWGTTALADLVQSAYTSDSTVGFLLEGPNENDGVRRIIKFASKEYSSGVYAPGLTIQYSVVPEPRTAVLGMLGLGIMAGLRRLGRRA